MLEMSPWHTDQGSRVDLVHKAGTALRPLHLLTLAKAPQVAARILSSRRLALRSHCVYA